MNKKIKNIFYVSSLLIFILSIKFFYFSEKNIVNTHKNRAMYNLKVKNKLDDIPLLKSDTKNIVEFSNDLESFKKKKKKYLFWKLLDK